MKLEKEKIHTLVNLPLHLCTQHTLKRICLGRYSYFDIEFRIIIQLKDGLSPNFSYLLSLHHCILLHPSTFTECQVPT
ncbi:hypothetical protein XELAEV_18030735mg [Xenopus laevis]|uniref:Uncharacterized protein n=1 Tax=Xenopus laevis TaxID=8355 RepID=A0A974CLC1_XENLA|nr:hypothetical protein XELAEV_18030735mg [Xenopus laevis]